MSTLYNLMHIHLSLGKAGGPTGAAHHADCVRDEHLAGRVHSAQAAVAEEELGSERLHRCCCSCILSSTRTAL